MYPFKRTMITVLALLSATASSAQSTGRQEAAKTQIGAFLKALGSGDRMAFERITTNDFRAFENGQILDRTVFFDRVQTAIRQGMSPKMYQTNQRSSIGDNVAAFNYVNHGTYSTPGGIRDITWLEIMTLRRTGARWRIDFIDSQVQASDTVVARDPASNEPAVPR